MEKTEKRTTHRKGIPQGAPISPGKHLSARSRPMDRKKDAGKSKKKEKRCFGSVRNADGEYAAEQPLGLPAVIAELSRWAAQNLDISIGNQRRIPAIRKTQTEAEDRKMQHNKGRCAKEEANQSEWRQGGEAKERFSSLQAASNNGFSAVAR